jgi:hypothetical protein
MIKVLQVDKSESFDVWYYVMVAVSVGYILTQSASRIASKADFKSVSCISVHINRKLLNVTYIGVVAVGLF